MEESDAIRLAVRSLVERYRSRCLWFVRSDWWPTDVDGIVRALDAIERSGDREGFVVAARIRSWLSAPSNAGSVASWPK